MTMTSIMQQAPGVHSRGAGPVPARANRAPEKHRGPPQGSLGNLRKPLFFLIFSENLRYFSMFFGQILRFWVKIT